MLNILHMIFDCHYYDIKVKIENTVNEEDIFYQIHYKYNNVKNRN